MTHAELSPSVLLEVFCRTSLEVFLERCFHELHPGARLEPAWHLSAMAHRLEQVERFDIDRLLITLPPRYMKSELCSVAYTAWLLGKDPSLRILSTSYGQDLAEKFHSDVRRIMLSKWYARTFPQTAAAIRRVTAHTLETALGGVRDATTLNGAITGFGYDYIIIDDPMKADDCASPTQREHVQRLYQETLQARIQDKRKGRIVIVMQRLHEDDLAGFVLELGGMTHLNLPAIALKDEIVPLTRGQTHVRRIGDGLSPIREPMTVLDRLRAEMGNRAFESQWQQNPSAADSAYVRLDRIQRYDEPPPRDRILCVVQSWDTASSTAPNADYSVGTTWGHDGKQWLLLDLVRVKLDYTDLLARVRAERKRWGTDQIIVENAGVGLALLSDLEQDLRCEGPPENHAPTCGRERASPRLNKLDRLMSQIDRVYSGEAKFPRDAPWLELLQKELTAFPDGKHDDQVDSVSQFLNWCVGASGRREVERSKVERWERR